MVLSCPRLRLPIKLYHLLLHQLVVQVVRLLVVLHRPLLLVIVFCLRFCIIFFLLLMVLIYRLLFLVVFHLLLLVIVCHLLFLVVFSPFLLVVVYCLLFLVVFHFLLLMVVFYLRFLVVVLYFLCSILAPKHYSGQVLCLMDIVLFCPPRHFSILFCPFHPYHLPVTQLYLFENDCLIKYSLFKGLVPQLNSRKNLI